MRAFVRYVILPGFGTLLFAAAIVVAAIIWGSAAPPPPLPAVNEPVAQQNITALPDRQFIRARDGTALAYRAYPGAMARAVILVHGSTAQAESMHGLARALHAMPDPPSVYAIDIRGHGQSGERGDIGYVGQLEDDLEDFLAAQSSAHPAAQWTMVGFSAGGGFALRVAGSHLSEKFRRYILLAPMLHHEAPTYRAQGGGWATPYMPRLIGLSLLDRLGLPWFQDLPVLAFAREDAEGKPYTYSYRLWRNFKAHEDYAADFRKMPAPPVVLVGAADELFIADAFPPLIKGIRADAEIGLLPGLGHMDMIFAEPAHHAIVAALAQD